MKRRTQRGRRPAPDGLQLRIKSAYELLRKGLRDHAGLGLDAEERRERYIDACIEGAGLRGTSVERHVRLRAQCVLQGKEKFCHNVKCHEPDECRRCPIVLR